MRALLLFVGILTASPVIAAERSIFYTAQFADATTVELRVVASSAALTIGKYDYDVTIGVVETDAHHQTIYEDPAGHAAQVRCSAPAYIAIGETQYPIFMGISRLSRTDWKGDLWRAFCSVPVS